MAEQIPFGIAENLLMKLGSAVFHEIGLMYGVRGELSKLKEKLSTVGAVLLDAEEKQESSCAVADWVRRLKDVVYDADDLLDDFATEDLRRKTDDRGRFAAQVSDFFSPSNQLAFRFKMAHGIKAIRERLDDIANDISKFNLISRVMSDVRVRNNGRETCSVVEKSHKIVGREENKREIIELLMQSSTQENLSMVVIVGMGGLGKTTLAQLVYNDQGVVSYFNLSMWVCVSVDFDVEVLVKNILMSATNEDVGNLRLEQLQKRLQEKLDGKRYLLVLDDVWNEDKRKWGQFITLLPVGANGSKILVTTRSTRVASVIGIDSPYIVEGLKDDESWDLFESLAFKKAEEQMHPNLVAIGKDIVKMCKGVPLIIETLGRMLYFKTQESHWTFFMDAGFVDDHDSSITRLLSSLKGLRVMKMSFFLRHKALSSLGKLSHLRYLDLSYGWFENLPNAITRLKHLQTLTLFNCIRLKELPRNMKKLINLRHLEIDEVNKLSYMPRGLGDLTNLQTLPLFWVRNDGGESRHKRMGRLNELRFLNNLRGQLQIKRLSNARGSEAKEAMLEGKQYLECLRLDWWKLPATQESEEAMLVMECLQPHPNLKELFIVDYPGVRFPNWMMNDGLDLLLPNLVKIQISSCDRSKVLPPFAQLPSLKYLELSNLIAVECMMDYPSSAKPFFPSLKTLQLSDLPNLKGWGMRDVAAEQAPSYPYLEDLRLDNTTVELCLHLISVSSSLKSVSIRRINDLISLPEGLQHVSTLQTLTIRGCSSLATLPDWIGRLTSLSELCIEKCPNLTSLPEEMRSLRHLHTLKINGCPYLYERCQKETGEDWPTISHIPEIIIRRW
ncbi:putative disease resistance protein RGA3 [Vitis vinifera]|uniref:Putative disease resistance protein RGA3 n=1 Tax=Vitis vinifera TaxID=29760 RepID=A0A438J1M2_VITVI|nr:putative disease resistance protein RGA3 [Vitis vinifera]